MGVGDLLDGGDPRAVGAEAVGPLRTGPLGLAALQVARGDVVGHRVTGDPAAGAHDHRELALVVEAAHHRRAAHRRSRGSGGGGELHEHQRLRGPLAAGLGDVVGVVETDPEDRPGRGHGGQQCDLLQRPRTAPFAPLAPCGGPLRERGVPQNVKHCEALVGERGHPAVRDGPGARVLGVVRDERGEAHGGSVRECSRGSVWAVCGSSKSGSKAPQNRGKGPSRSGTRAGVQPRGYARLAPWQA